MDGPDLLRAWLRETGTSGAALARRLGVTPGLVSHWVQGRRAPGLADAVVLSDLSAGAVPVRAWVDERVRAVK